MNCRGKYISSDVFLLNILLIISILLCYSYAFYDVARADQLIYLHRTQNVKSLFDSTLGAYNFNRTNSIGDFGLFRPVLYFLLGFERWIWGYNFFAWQLVSIGLHCSVVVSIFFYCRYSLLKSSNNTNHNKILNLVSFSISIFFALLYSGTELVAWHHIVGYLFFSLLVVQSALAFQMALDSFGARNSFLLWILVAIASFTYELGNILAILYALALVFHRYKCVSLENRPMNLNLVILPIALLMIPVMYALISYADYVEHIGSPANISGGLANIIDIVKGVIFSSVYWLFYALCPTTLDMRIGGRIEHNLYQHINVFYLLGIIPALSLIVVSSAAIKNNFKWIFTNSKCYFPILVFFLMMVSYSLVIVLGRGMEKGIISILLNNGYYSYIFSLFLIIFIVRLVIVPLFHTYTPTNSTHLYIIAVLFLVIAIAGGWKTFSTHKNMYESYSSRVNRLLTNIETVKNLHIKDGEFTFSVDKVTCNGVESAYLEWFAPHALQKRENYNIANVLYPLEYREVGGKYLIKCQP